MTTRFSDLPSPEERILKSVHASQRKVEQSSLGILVPVLPSVPECAIRVQGRVGRDTVQVETTIVDTVAVFSANGNTELGLTEKKSIKLWTKNDKLTVAHLVETPAFQEQAFAGQVPPI